jgi:ABC-type transporter Mla subunit MlaD
MWMQQVEVAGRFVLLPELPRPPTKIQDLIVEELKRRLDAVVVVWADALSGPARSLRETVEAAKGSIEEIRRALNGLEISTKDLNSFAKSAREIKSASDIMAKAANSYATNAELLSGAVGQFDNGLSALVHSIDGANATTLGMQDVLKESRTEISHQAQRLAEAIAHVESRFDGLAGVISERMQQESQVSLGARDAVAELRTHLGLLKPALDAMSEGGNQMSLASFRVSDLADKSLLPLPDKLTEALARSFGEWQAKQELLVLEIRDQLINKASRSLNNASQNLSDVATNMTATARSVRLNAEDLSRNIAKQTDSFNSALLELRNCGNQLLHAWRRLPLEFFQDVRRPAGEDQSELEANSESPVVSFLEPRRATGAAPNRNEQDGRADSNQRDGPRHESPGEAGTSTIKESSVGDPISVSSHHEVRDEEYSELGTEPAGDAQARPVIFPFGGDESQSTETFAPEGGNSPSWPARDENTSGPRPDAHRIRIQRQPPEREHAEPSMLPPAGERLGSRLRRWILGSSH